MLFTKIVVRHYRSGQVVVYFFVFVSLASEVHGLDLNTTVYKKPTWFQIWNKSSLFEQIFETCWNIFHN